MPSDLPDGPRLPGSVQAIAYHRDPLAVLRRAKARYGPVFTLVFPLKGPLIFASSPAALPGLLNADPDRARAGEARRKIRRAAEIGYEFRSDSSPEALAQLSAAPLQPVPSPPVLVRNWPSENRMPSLPRRAEFFSKSSN